MCGILSIVPNVWLCVVLAHSKNDHIAFVGGGLFYYHLLFKNLIITLNEWIVKGEVGISSKTMWAAITGAVTTGDKGLKFDVPHDPDDFRRCLKFVTDCGIDDEQMLLVKNVFPWFAPFIDNWGKMLKLWIEESPKGSCPKLYDYMQDLENQSIVLAGFVRDGKSSWKKDKTNSVV